MGIITSTTLPAPVQQSFSNKLLSVSVPYMIHKIPAELKTMPRQGGRVLRFRRYNPLATAPVPLGNSGISPPPQTASAINIDARPDFYGTYLILNEQVTLQSQDPVLNQLVERLGVSLRETEDELMRDMLASTATFVNCVSGTNGDNPTEITRQDCDFVVRTLRGNNAYSFTSGIQGENKFGTAPVRDAYFSLSHTDMIGQLDAVQGFISKWNYPSQDSTLDPEWGTVANIRFLLSSIGSTTTAASLLGATIYNNFVCGRESFAAVEQDGYSAQFVYLPPQFSGPLALNATIGWKMAECPRILNTTWVFNLRCTLA
ncbi:MAG: N4-gp56 family major capsid protein [Bacteroidetes bacterium]|nr:N4-gp56 family major capsid protein [Bacteroidota bacterium]